MKKVVLLVLATVFGILTLSFASARNWHGVCAIVHAPSGQDFMVGNGQNCIDN